MILYQISQILIKFFITIAIGVPVIWTLIKVWKMDIDLNRLLSPKQVIERAGKNAEEKMSWIPQREKDAIYQNGEKVAKVLGVSRIDEGRGKVFIEEIYQANQFNIGEEFEYQKLRLKMISAETMVNLNANAIEKGRMITKVNCQIIDLK